MRSRASARARRGEPRRRRLLARHRRVQRRLRGRDAALDRIATSRAVARSSRAQPRRGARKRPLLRAPGVNPVAQRALVGRPRGNGGEGGER